MNDPELEDICKRAPTYLSKHTDYYAKFVYANCRFLSGNKDQQTWHIAQILKETAEECLANCWVKKADIKKVNGLLLAKICPTADFVGDNEENQDNFVHAMEMGLQKCIRKAYEDADQINVAPPEEIMVNGYKYKLTSPIPEGKRKATELLILSGINF